MSGDRAAAFLDRDGTLIVDVGYPRDPDGVTLLDGAAEALAALAASGLRLVVVSNQSGVGRGIVTPEQAEAVHDRFVAELAAEGIALDDAKYCPHAPGAGCACRKPEPAMLLEAAAELDLDLEASFMIGDKHSDVETGRRAGCRTVLLGDADGAAAADCVAADWREAVAFILDAEAGR